MRRIKIRLVLELIGLTALSYGAWHEKSLIVSSWQNIQNSNVGLVILCFGLAWLNFLWSGIGYKILAPKIRLLHICFANLAASGPGRVIPGGAGYLSFGVLFLSKQGIKTYKAIAIAIANNLIGFLVNVIVLIVIFATNPSIANNINIGSLDIRVVLGVLVVVFALFIVLSRNKFTKKSTNKTKSELYLIASRIYKSPKTLFGLFFTMIAIIATNSTILYLAGHSVNMPIGIGQAVLVMSIGVSAGSLLPTPGGVGGVEAGLIAALLLLGFDEVSAGGTVLVYRAATYLQPFIPGFISYLYLRKKRLL